MHGKVLESLTEKLLTLLPEQFLFNITDKFNTFDLTTRVLSPLFPQMADYTPERKITFDIGQIHAKPMLNAKDQSIGAMISTSLNVITINPATGK